MALRTILSFGYSCWHPMIPRETLAEDAAPAHKHARNIGWRTYYCSPAVPVAAPPAHDR